jgi:hypothetical protein
MRQLTSTLTSVLGVERSRFSKDLGGIRYEPHVGPVLLRSGAGVLAACPCCNQNPQAFSTASETQDMGNVEANHL